MSAGRRSAAEIGHRELVPEATLAAVTSQRFVGWITTRCRPCSGQRKHGLWEVHGSRARKRHQILTCNECGGERTLERPPKVGATA